MCSKHNFFFSFLGSVMARICLYTTMFNIQRFYIVSTEYIYVFCTDIRKKKTIFAPYNINGLVVYN